jgi:hypothetical protein
MNKKEKIKYITVQIWELRLRMYIWRFIFGNESSKEKVEEFIQYFTGRILYEFQESLLTKILVDLKRVIDTKKNVISIFNIIDKDKLKKLNHLYKNIKIFTNNFVTHKSLNKGFTFTFLEIWDTIQELQNVINVEMAKEDHEIIWYSEDKIKN